MAEAPIELIVAAFNDEEGADAALKELKEAKKEKLIGIQAAVALRKDEKGKLHTKDAGLTPGKGAAAGGILGAVVGILTGGVGLVMGAAGALVGGLVGKKKRDERFNPQRIEQLAEALKPGSSAIVAVIEHTWVAQLEEEFEQLGADVLTAAIAADVAQQLESGHSVAYSAVADESGLTTSRIAAGADSVVASSTSFTDEAVQHVEAVATEAGIAGRRIVTTTEGVAEEVAVVTENAIAYGAAVVTDEGTEMAGFIATAEDVAQVEEAAEEETPSKE